MSAHSKTGRYGAFYKTGHWERTIAFWVDKPDPMDGRRIVCGCCVAGLPSEEGRSIGGDFLCEACGKPCGREVAHEDAIAITEGPLHSLEDRTHE